MRRWDEAEGWYPEAAALGDGRWGNLGSTRRNARLILRALGEDHSRIDRCFNIPPVVAFSGHLLDRVIPRFPPALEGPVRLAILERLRTLQPGFGYAAAGCGGDILFLEAIQERGGEVQVVLPYDRAQFRTDSVDLIPGGDWGDRYDRLLASATEVTTASDRRLGTGSISYEYGFQLLDGVACLRADALATDLICLALWDGRPGDGPGGTASSVALWRSAGRQVEVVDLAAIVHRHGTLTVRTTSPGRGEAPTGPSAASVGRGPGTPVLVEPQSARTAPSGAFEPAIVGLLFADVQGFSRLTEEELPLFVEHFLGKVAQGIEALADPPLLTNTWGDGLYLVFRGVREAGTFAMELRRTVVETHWPDHGLPDGLSLRIALHAGPAYACQDPVTRRLNYLGSNVNMAARIEPVTPPGDVYASGAFAALARSVGVENFSCGHVGRMPLAKGYGTVPVYVLHRGIPPGAASQVP